MEIGSQVGIGFNFFLKLSNASFEAFDEPVNIERDLLTSIEACDPSGLRAVGRE